MADLVNRLSARQAARLRWSILGFSLLSLALVFQPFSHLLFKLGIGLSFLSMVVFNLMPALVQGNEWRAVARVAGVILLVLAGLVAFATLSAWGYVLYLQR